MRTLTIFLSALAVATTVAQQKPEQPKFETSAEVVLVDVTVSSANGEPVTGLTAADFKLTVNGQPRAVHTLQFISSRGMKPPVEVPRLASVSSNEGATTGRLLLFAVDENHLRLGGARAVLQTAERVMSALAPGDLIGVARLPTGRGGVEFTTDRERVRRGLQGVMGAQPMRDTDRVRLSEAHAFEMRDETTWQQVIERECNNALAASLARESCVDSVEAEARSVVATAAARARVSIDAFEQLTKRLAALKTPISVLLISEGLYVGRDRADLSTLARLAAEARLTFYVVQPDEQVFDLDQPSITGGFIHQSALTEGLEQIAGLTRGSFFKIAGGSGAGVFDRISRELSGYYLLSFEPTDSDRSSRDRRIKVEVERRGLTVKSRSTYALANTAGARDVTAMPPEEQVKSLLAAPLPTPGLPIRVATYSVTTGEANRVRVVLAAEVGDAAANSAEWPVGVMVFNSQDKVFVDSIRYMTLEPVTDRAPSPRLLTMTMVLEPGEYSLRLAAIDHEGKSGSVHHMIDARLHRLSGDAVRASDLMISSDLVDAGVPRPRPTAVHHTETMYSILELTGDASRVGKARVTVQVADSDSAPALVNVEARPLPGGTQSRRTFAAVAKLDVLPPGEYVARAIVKVSGQSDAVLSRPFRLEPIAALAAPASSAPRSVDDAPAPLPAAKVAAPVARFAMEDVLKPEITRRFIEYLQREHPAAPANNAIVQQALDGKFAPALESTGALADGEVTLAFIRGLAHLQQKQYPQAAASFQLALKGASDFLGAALYIGALHAAAGRDTDAIGAWQMATIGENSEAVYPLLVDAMLRVGDAKRALDTIVEMPEAWPDDDSRLQRIATAQAMLGEFEPALKTLSELLDRRRDDQEVLFLAIQVFYRLHQAKALPAADRTRFDEYSKRYLDAKGPDSALVQTWRRFVLGR